MTENNVVVMEAVPPRPLSPVMRQDLCRIAQRMIDTEGRVVVRKLHKAVSSRIPGTVAQYSITIAQLLNKRELRFNRRRSRK